MIPLFIKRFICSWFHPTWKIIAQSKGGNTYKVECNSCHLLYGMNDDVRAVLPWSEEMEKFF